MSSTWLTNFSKKRSGRAGVEIQVTKEDLLAQKRAWGIVEKLTSAGGKILGSSALLSLLPTLELDGPILEILLTAATVGCYKLHQYAVLKLSELDQKLENEANTLDSSIVDSTLLAEEYLCDER